MTVSDLSISVHLIEAALWLPASHSCCHDCPAMMGCTPNCDCPAIMGCTPNCDCPAWWAVPQTVTVCVFACSCMMQAHGIQRIAFGFIFLGIFYFLFETRSFTGLELHRVGQANPPSASVSHLTATGMPSVPGFWLRFWDWSSHPLFASQAFPELSCQIPFAVDCLDWLFGSLTAELELFGL